MTHLSRWQARSRDKRGGERVVAVGLGDERRVKAAKQEQAEVRAENRAIREDVGVRVR